MAVAYLRVSTEDQNLGPEAQRAAIERWAAGREVTVAVWFEDRLSGATAVEDRPGLVAALAGGPRTRRRAASGRQARPDRT